MRLIEKGRFAFIIVILFHGLDLWLRKKDKESCEFEHSPLCSLTVWLPWTSLLMLF